MNPLLYLYLLNWTNVINIGLDGDGGVVLAKGQSRTPLYKPNTTTGEGNVTLSQCNISDGEFISVYKVVEFERMTSSANAAARRGNNGGNAGASPARQRQRTNNTATAGGGLDFSALLGGGAPAARAPAASSSGGMDFTALLSRGAATASATSSSTSAQGGGGSELVEWDGMTLHDALEKNPNPTHLMTLLSNTTRHPNLMKQLNFNNPTLAKKLQAHDGDITKMAETWRQHELKNATSGKSAFVLFYHVHMCVLPSIAFICFPLQPACTNIYVMFTFSPRS